MGVVLEGEAPRTDRLVAIKLLLPEHHGNHRRAARFRREAKIMARLRGRGIVPVLDRGWLPDGRPYYVMELVSGQTLAERLARRPSPGHLTALLEVLQRACETIARAHAHGIVHHDLKPGNIMVDDRGEVQVMGWGLARVVASRGRQSPEAAPSPGGIDVPGSPAQAGTVQETPGHIAPEQRDLRSDVFSLGAILCEVLTGRPPDCGARDEVVRQAHPGNLEEAPQRLRHCDAGADLVALALACLDPSQERRPADAGAVARLLGGFLQREAERLRHEQVRRDLDAEGTAQAALVRARERFTTGDLAGALAEVRGVQDLLQGPLAERLGVPFGRLIADLKMVARLEDARAFLLETDRAAASRDDASRSYREAFQQYGVDVERREAGAVAAALDSSPLRWELLSALEEWAWLAAAPALAQRLLEIANLLDREPEGQRFRLRNALRWRDEPALIEFAARAGTLALPGPASIALAAAISHCADGEFAVDVLRLAWAQSRDVRVACHLIHALARAQPARPDEVVAAARQGLEVDPRCVQLHEQLGRALVAAKQYDRAEAALRAGLEDCPGNPRLVNQLARLLVDQERHDEAEGLFALADSPASAAGDRADACLGLALACARQGKKARAEEAFQRAESLRRPSSAAYLDFATILERWGWLEDAERLYRSAIRDDGDNAALFLGLARVLDGRGQLIEAGEAARKAVERNRSLAGAGDLLTRLDQELTGWKAAGQMLHRILERWPDHDEAKARLAALHVAADRAEVERCCAQAQEVGRERFRFVLAQARAALAGGQTEQAHQECAFALELGCGECADWQQLGEIALGLQAPQLALAAFRKVRTRTAEVICAIGRARELWRKHQAKLWQDTQPLTAPLVAAGAAPGPPSPPPTPDDAIPNLAPNRPDHAATWLRRLWNRLVGWC
jgi:tetratricopeptide (TPR) repeat protein